jgi:hypothetical protein
MTAIFLRLNDEWLIALGIEGSTLLSVRTGEIRELPMMMFDVWSTNNNYVSSTKYMAFTQMSEGGLSHYLFLHDLESGETHDTDFSVAFALIGGWPGSTRLLGVDNAGRMLIGIFTDDSQFMVLVTPFE